MVGKRSRWRLAVALQVMMTRALLAHHSCNAGTENRSREMYGRQVDC